MKNYRVSYTRPTGTPVVNEEGIVEIKKKPVRKKLVASSSDVYVERNSHYPTFSKGDELYEYYKSKQDAIGVFEQDVDYDKAEFSRSMINRIQKEFFSGTDKINIVQFSRYYRIVSLYLKYLEVIPNGYLAKACKEESLRVETT